jgi:hypothetical protein
MPYKDFKIPPSIASKNNEPLVIVDNFGYRVTSRFQRNQLDSKLEHITQTFAKVWPRVKTWQDLVKMGFEIQPLTPEFEAKEKEMKEDYIYSR